MSHGFTHRTGFTLIELLIVVAIIAILGSFLVAGIGWFQERAQRTQTRSLLQKVVNGITSYQQDYGRLMPCPGFAVGSWVEAEAGAQMLHLELVTKLNDGRGRPRRGYLTDTIDRVYISDAISEADRGLIDRWGNPLIYVARKYDGTWPIGFSPYTGREMDYELWSAGPDGAFADLRGTDPGDPDADNIPAAVYDPSASNQQY